MASIHNHIANATGELNGLFDMIHDSLNTVKPIVEKELHADGIDIIFVSAPALVIPEYGIGGNSPGPNHIYVSFDPNSDKITQEGLVETLLHEIHHCMRWRNPGYGETLGEAMITEGLACLYEEEHSNKPPMYATIQLPNGQVEEAMEKLDANNYDHSRWFFGSEDIVKWFGYTYGYQLCKKYSELSGKKASELATIPASKILTSINK